MLYYGTDRNRRFPFTLKALRPAVGPSGMPVFDENGDPTEEVIQLDLCRMNGEGYPIRDSSGAYVTDKVDSVNWGYRTSTGGIKDSGEVFKTDFKIGCPKFVTHLPQGTVLELTDDTHTWRAVVQKCTSYNWGTNIWFDNPGNNGKVEST